MTAPHSPSSVSTFGRSGGQLSNSGGESSSSFPVIIMVVSQYSEFPAASVTVSRMSFSPGVVKVFSESTILSMSQLSVEPLSMSSTSIVTVPLTSANSFPGGIH